MISRKPDLKDGSREERLRHAAESAECREAMFGRRPERLFSLLALETAPEDELDSLSAAVMRRIEGQGAGRRRRLWLRRLLPVAASIVLAGFFSIYTTLQEIESPPGITMLEPFLEAKVPSDGIELISSPGEAQVMEFTVGETQIVMIFDEAMDI
jgi:hypothetical protein